MVSKFMAAPTAVAVTFIYSISHKTSPPFGWYLLRQPTKGWPGWVDLGGWSHTEINVLRR